MGVGKGRQGRPWSPPGFLKFQQKKVDFLVSKGKKQISPLLPPYKNFGKFPWWPPWKKFFRRPWFR